MRSSLVSAALVLGGLPLAAVAAGAGHVGDDYMSGELRARVEGLKADVAAAPTTVADVKGRADVLWEWANAYALAGGVIPNDLPLLVRTSRQAGDADTKGVAEYTRGLDFMVRELQIKDEVPGALGTVKLDRTDPLVAEDWVTVVQTWTVGEMPMAEGGAIYLGRDGFNNQGAPQVKDPAGDNYFTIRASNPDARFVYQGVGLRQSLVTRIEGIFRLEGTSLKKGDTVTLTYGDRSGGSRGFQMQSYSVTQCRFPIYLDLEGKGNFMQPWWPSVVIVGKPEVSAATVFVPSIVAPGEPFRVVVRSEDDRYNRASGPAPEYRVLLNGEPYSSLPAGGPALAAIENVSIAEPGVYRFAVSSADGRVAATSNAVWVRLDPTHRIYWGDTHAHIGYSDAQGTPDGFFTFARDDANLDFVTLSEHDLWLDDHEWQTLQRKVIEYHQDGRFIPILGFEWTVSPPGGHHNVLFRNPWMSRVGSQIAWLLPDLYRQLRRRVRADDVLVIPHAHSPGNWTISDPDLERLVEITSTHGTFEWFGDRYLGQGWEVGFVGSSDNHHEHPGHTDTGTTFHTQRGGLAGVLAPAKTTDGIFDSLRHLKAYATSNGTRIILDATLDGVQMGTRVPFTAQPRLACRVMGTAAVDTIDVIKNGELVYQKRYISESPEPHSWVRVGFESSSEVSTYKAPRNYRVWKGTLTVVGARLVGFRAPNMEDRLLEHARAAGPDAVEFEILTRGARDNLLLELEGVGPDSAIRLHVDAGASGFPRLDTEPVDTTLALAAATDGRLRQELTVTDPATGAPGTDAVSLLVFDPAASLDQEFAYTDLGEARPGDYYYLRVTQVDGEMAWSSPWWVGGEVPSVETPPARGDGGS